MGAIVITDIIEGRTLTEGVLARAWRDTIGSITKPWFWFLTIALTSVGAVFTPGGWQRVGIAFGLGVAPFVLSLLFHIVKTPFHQRDEARRWAAKLKKQLDEPHVRKAADLDAHLDPGRTPHYPVLVISASGDTSAKDVVVELEPATVLFAGEPTSFESIEPQQNERLHLAITYDDFTQTRPIVLVHLKWKDDRGAHAKDVPLSVW